jgi:hypothetical protein
VLVEDLAGVAMGDGEGVRVLNEPLFAEGGVRVVFDLLAVAVGQDVGAVKVIAVVVSEDRVADLCSDLGGRDCDKQRDQE